MASRKITQKEHRQSIKVGPHFDSVSPAMYWYRGGHFENDDQAKGAFELAYQQALDGMGKTPWEWMGMTSAEYSNWVGTRTLPKR